MIENTDSVRTYVADLIDISGMSQSAVAGKAGIFRGNLQKWLRGQGQSLGPPGVSKVLSALNVESGHLSRAIVHFFDVKEPSPLLRVLQREGGGVFRMVAVAPEKSSPRDFLTWGVTVPLFVFSREVRIVIWQSAAFSVPASGSLLKTGVVWEDLPPDPFFLFPVVRVPREVFEKIRKRDLSVSDYDSILSPEKKESTWADLISECQALGLSPGEAIHLISKKGKK